MKKIFLGILPALLFATAAGAADKEIYIPYAGVDYSYIQAKADGVKPLYHALNLNFGTKYNQYFGTELFFEQSGSDSKKTQDGKFKSSFRAYGLDIAAYLPLGCYHRAELLATAGVGEYVFKEKFGAEKHHNDSGWGYRIGGGVLYNFDENISLRLLARYVSLDRVAGFDHLTEFSAGIRYHFM